MKDPRVRHCADMVERGQGTRYMQHFMHPKFLRDGHNTDEVITEDELYRLVLKKQQHGKDSLSGKELELLNQAGDGEGSGEVIAVGSDKNRGYKK